MAIAKVQYKENASATPEVWMDTTQKTVTAGTMLSGTTALKNDGTGITGNIASKSSSDLTASGATVTAPAGYYPNAANKAVASGSASTPATSITANPTISVNASGLITASVSGSKSVTPAVSAGYVSSGTAGTVSVSGSNTQQLSTQAATTITPSTTSQTAVAAGKYTTGAVTVAAMPSGTAGTPTATKGTVSNHSVSITPSVTNTTGYITGSTISGTAVTVNVTELESGTKSITENGTGISVSGYSAVDVAVPGQTPTGVKYIDTDIDGEGAWNVAGYEYCAVDGAPVLDGHLRLWLDLTSITDSFSTSILMGLNREQGSYSIDWGDGTTPVSVSTSAFTKTSDHTYSVAGLYVIDITLTSGKLQLYSINNATTPYYIYVEARGLNPELINSVNFPGMSNSGLKSIWFGDEITTPGKLQGNRNLKNIRLSPQQSSISANFLNGCSALQKITIPSSVSSLGKNAFRACSSLQEIHFLSTTPPTMENSGSDSPFYETPSSMVIYVPSASLSAYQSATNWSVYASQMVGE